MGSVEILLNSEDLLVRLGVRGAASDGTSLFGSEGLRGDLEHLSGETAAFWSLLGLALHLSLLALDTFRVFSGLPSCRKPLEDLRAWLLLLYVLFTAGRDNPVLFTEEPERALDTFLVTSDSAATREDDFDLGLRVPSEIGRCIFRNLPLVGLTSGSLTTGSSPTET